jgi:solute carrier family 25 2-oxodicarboxylate transporter 21
MRAPRLALFASAVISALVIFFGRYPLDVIKTRAQLGHGSSSFGTIVSSLRTIQQKEGFRTLYRGISAPMSIEPVKRVRRSLLFFLPGHFLQRIFLRGSSLLTLLAFRP